MKNTILITALALLLPQLAVAKPGEEHTISCNKDKAKQTHRLEVAKKDVVYMIAGSNGSTGYKWVSKDGLKSEYVDTSGGRVGGGGVEGFEIKVSKIRGDRKAYVFEYKRPWETDGKPAAVCTIDLTIE